MVKLTGIFNQFRRNKVMVVGDLMLDTYTIGKAKRISPEAPVAVVHVQKEEHRPGGAGNVILNLISLGAEVVAVGRIGQDGPGHCLQKALQEKGVDTSGIHPQLDFFTPVKNRILAENQQIVRVDHEIVKPLSHEIEQAVIGQLSQLLEGVKVVAISDYGKGFLSATLLQALIQLAKKKQIPVISDPKGMDFAKYNGSTVLKPNNSEAYAAANLPTDTPLEKVAHRLFQMMDVEMLMVTRSEAGITLFSKQGTRQDFPVRMREIKDVTGAGDTVLAMLACALANGLPIGTSIQLANVAAGLAIEEFGCAQITLSKVARRSLEEDVTNKVFDKEHLFALQEAVKGHPLAIVSISGKNGLTGEIFNTIRKGHTGNRDVLVCVRDQNPDPEFVHMIASLHGVNFVLLYCENMETLSLAFQPVEISIVP